MTSSGGSSINHWRLLTQLRSYLAKNYPSITSESLQKDIAKLLKVASKDVHTPENNKKTATNSDITEEENVKELPQTAVQDVNQSYTDVRKALMSLNSYLPTLPILSLRNEEPLPQEGNQKASPLPKWMVKKKDTVSRASVDSRTRHLIKGLQPGMTNSATLRRLEDLCTHLRNYPETRGVAVKCSGISRLLNVIKATKDVYTADMARLTLAILGYTNPVKGHGIRVLSIDGGGVRGLIAIDMLRHLEQKAGRPIYELFDFVCGVSTGAILAVLIGVHHLTLNECEKLYRQISTQVFSQTAFKGTASLVWRHSYYDSDAWTEILKKNMGDIPLIESTKTSEINKLCLVSMQTNNNWVKAYLFRNYNFPYRTASHFSGCSSSRIWEGVRASAAAPGYFSEFRLNDLILLDGGVMVNNPAAIAIHEARSLWPGTPLQTVVSIGTGRHEPLAKEMEKSINWASRLRTIINSATDTEGVHTTLHDLLPGNVYFRFNPYLSEEINLDEIRSEKLALMMEETALYVRKNESKFNGAVDSLTRTKSLADKVYDYIDYKKQLWDL